MSDFTLHVPDEVMAAARRIADATEQPVEAILLNRLKTALPLPVLPPDEEAELEALRYLSDDALWTIAREQMPDALQERMQVLMDKNTSGALSSEARNELQALVDRGERLMLRKSEAAVILSRRGYRVKPEDLSTGE